MEQKSKTIERRTEEEWKNCRSVVEEQRESRERTMEEEWKKRKTRMEQCKRKTEPAWNNFRTRVAQE